MSHSARHAYRTTRAYRAKQTAENRLDVEPAHRSAADLAALPAAAKQDGHPPAAFRRHQALGQMTDAELQARASWLAYGRAALERKEQSALAAGDDAVATAMEKAVAGMTKSIKELAKFLDIDHWPALLTPGQSIEAVLRAQNAVSPRGNQVTGASPDEMWEEYRKRFNEVQFASPPPVEAVNFENADQMYALAKELLKQQSILLMREDFLLSNVGVPKDLFGLYPFLGRNYWENNRYARLDWLLSDIPDRINPSHLNHYLYLVLCVAVARAAQRANQN